LRFDDFSRATRSLTIAEASAESRVLLGAARELMEAALPMIGVRGCTLVGLSLTNLEDIDAVQLALPVDRVRTLALDEAVDEVREKFGSRMLTRGVLVGRDSGIEMPLLPND
jgi:DNA polymerase IV